MPWSQNYDPLNSLAASTLVAAIPVVLLLALLAVTSSETILAEMEEHWEPQ